VTIQAAKNCNQTYSHRYDGQGSDPVRPACVKAISRPGGNVTALQPFARELGGRRLELFKEAIPKLSRVRFSTIRPIAASLHEVKELSHRRAVR